MGEIRTEKVSLSVSDGSTMAAYAAAPSGGGRHPSLIVLQEAFGVNAHIRDMTERFARDGYVCIAPELFHRTAPGFEGEYGNFEPIKPHYMALTNEGLIADLQAAYDWLGNDNSGAPTASVGWCLGGKVSFLAATALPLACAVSYYGGGIAPNAMSQGILDRVGDAKAPVLFHWGGKDGHIGPDQIRAVTETMDAAGKAYINVVYSQADHGFNCDARPSYHAESAKEALALTRAFLELHTG